ncbi:MAG: hypothetical protein ACTSRA_11480 [Promethearchaeota archaeon]
MLGFIQFYIWYQMITGVVQVTIVSVMALYVFPGTDLEYATWLFLILSTTQYPGMLGYFKTILRGLQQFKYDNIVDFLRSNVFDFLSRLFFILFFRWVGSNDPRIGDLMGCAIGSAVGRYVDEFANMALAIYFFDKVMKPYGIRAKDCFGHSNISWDVIKTSAWWGIQLSLPGMISSTWQFVGLLIWLQYLPSYTFWITISGVTDMVTRILTIGSKLSLTAATSEAYMNGKTQLGQYYLANSYKWYFSLLFGVLGLLVTFLNPLMQVILSLEGAERYALAIPFIIPKIVFSIFGPLGGFLDGIIIGTNHPTAKTFIDIAGGVSGLIWHFFSLGILRWHEHFGITGIVIIFTFAGFSNWLVYFFIKWIFVEYCVFHIKIPVWQAIIAPILASLGIIAVGQVWYQGVYNLFLIPSSKNIVENILLAFGTEPAEAASLGVEYGGVFAAGITLLIALTVFLFGIYLPLYGFFGGWDDFGLLIFRKAYHLSGPSNAFVRLMYRGTELGAKVSNKTVKLHNRFPIEASIPFTQSIELLIERQIHDIKSGFAPGSPEALRALEIKKEKEKAELKPPRSYILDFFKNFKAYFLAFDRGKKISLLFSVILVSITMSPVFFYGLGHIFFTDNLVWSTWIVYLVLSSSVGITGLVFSRVYSKKHDGIQRAEEISYKSTKDTR